MNDQNLPQKSPPPPGGMPKIFWVAVAFAPSVATLLIIKLLDYRVLSDVFLWIALVGVICSGLAAGQLASGIKRSLARAAGFLFLTLFFVIANLLLSLFIGCAA
jgi:hypothetical protein